jgi:hypothetical protein
LLRTEICLNGDWDVVLNAGDESIPASGWQHRRVPAMPLIGDTPAVSAWYKKSFTIPREWAKPGRQFILHLDKVGHYAGVYCNGKRIAEHYGQYDPVEADLTGALKPGAANEIAIYAHNASGKYARPGAMITEAFEGNAYRGAAEAAEVRNWVGIVGDITLAWRPVTHVGEVFVIPSVRKKRLEARVATEGAGSGLTLRAAVLDKEKIVLKLPEKPAKSGETSTLEADWSDPVLWGPPGYGEPKLYVLRTELVKQGKVVDRSFTRFGFREVWISGRDMLLNGKKLWMAGTYFGKLNTLRYLNDRHPQSLMLSLMQASGLNTMHGHWDDLGTPWMDRCDEMGMLVLGGFFCDGRPKIHSKADDGWEDWMVKTCARWVRVTRNHPSIIAWRPADVIPPNMSNKRPEVWGRLDEQVRREDGTRPIADDSDIQAWSQSPLKAPGQYDDGSKMAAALAESTKPFLTKEIYGGFGEGEQGFYRIYYEKAFKGGGTGVIAQQMPLLERHGRFKIEWLSESGLGNRDLAAGDTPNWCDPTQPAWVPSAMSKLFAEAYQKFTQRVPAPVSAETAGEVLVGGLAPDDLAILMPRNPDVAEAAGVRADTGGKAWIAAQAGDYRVYYSKGSQEIAVPPGRFPLKPGYEAVERVTVHK